VFSSRTSALAGERHLAFLAIVGQERPDFRTISACRTLHLEAFKDVFVPVVRLAGELGLVRLGNVATDGTKMQGHASRHTAMRYGYRQKAVERLREEIAAWVTQAYQQDAAEEAALGSRRGDALPAELARREERLVQIEAAMRRLETQAKADAQGERQRRWCPSIAWMKGLRSMIGYLLIEPVAKVRGHTIAQQLLHGPHMVRQTCRHSRRGWLPLLG
jgi:hypothetical protein